MTASFSLYGAGIPRRRDHGKEYTAYTSHPICAWSHPLCYLSHASAQRLLVSCTSRSSARSPLQKSARPVPTGSIFSYGFFFKKLQRIRGVARPSPPATEDDRRRTAVAGMARPTRPVAWCHPGCRCNQRRTLPARTGTPLVLWTRRKGVRNRCSQVSCQYPVACPPYFPLSFTSSIRYKRFKRLCRSWIVP